MANRYYRPAQGPISESGDSSSSVTALFFIRILLDPAVLSCPGQQMIFSHFATSSLRFVEWPVSLKSFCTEGWSAALKNKSFNQSSFTASYDHFPILSSKYLYHIPPSPSLPSNSHNPPPAYVGIFNANAAVSEVLASYRRRNIPDSRVAPHFVGYFGEHEYLYPEGTTQLAGDVSFHVGRRPVPYGKLLVHHITNGYLKLIRTWNRSQCPQNVVLSNPATQFQQEHQTALATLRLTMRTMFDPP